MIDPWDNLIERIARTLSGLQDGDFEVYEYADEPAAEGSGDEGFGSGGFRSGGSSAGGSGSGAGSPATSSPGPQKQSRSRRRKPKHSRYGQCIFADPEKYEVGGYIVEVGAKKYGGWFRDDGFPENPEGLAAIGFRRYSPRENWRTELTSPEEAARALVLGMRDGRDCTEIWRFWRATS
ncbi:hypothetical protein GCM10022261_19370 [Brevibacterium daeguense]|uniref:Uncharacterized protein n=1 Tax=Brevibacterium daeguense TaxID=909936 RepID=A0ABP8EK92_9MICO|nr:hypothetical protein [Brevibacterium daeguense]